MCDEQTEAGVVVRVGKEQRPASYDAQTRQTHELPVVRHDEHVPGHLLDVLTTHTTRHVNPLMHKVAKMVSLA